MLNFRSIAMIFVCLVLAVFVGRGFYFLPNESFYSKISHDDSWFYSYAAILADDFRGDKLNEFQSHRDAIRTSLEKRLFRGIASSSVKHDVPVSRILFFLSLGVFLFAALFTVLTVNELVKEPVTRLIAIAAVVGAYSFRWLNYYLFVPKMFGWALVTCAIYFIVRYLKHDRVRDLIITFMVAWLCLLVYPAAFVYYFPIAFLVLLLAKHKIDRASFIMGAVFFVIYLVTVLLYPRPPGLHEAPPLNVTETFYRNHYLSRSDLVKFLVSIFHITLLLFTVQFVKFKEVRYSKMKEFNMVHFFSVCAVFFIIFGFVAENLMAKIDFFRMTWVQRGGYFFYVSALFAVIAVLGLPSSIKRQNSNRIAIGLLFFFIIAFISHGKNSGIAGWYRFISGRHISKRDKKEVEVLEFIKNNQLKGNIIFTPERRYTLLPAFVEAETDLKVLYSDIERPVFIGMSEMTMNIFNKISTLKASFSKVPIDDSAVVKLMIEDDARFLLTSYELESTLFAVRFKNNSFALLELAEQK